MKNEKGITLILLAATVLIMIIVLGTITYTSMDSFKMDQYYKMCSDVELLDGKTVLYYLEHKDDKDDNFGLPIDDDKIRASSELETIVTTPGNVNYNPNNSGELYKIDLGKLDNLTLNHTGDYYIDKQSHTVYYSQGYEVDGDVYYTIKKEYQASDINKIVLKPNENTENPESVTFSTNYGTIDVIWLDTSNNVIAEPNSPSEHLAGMTKVTWTENADHSATEDGNPKINWYSYTAGNETEDNRNSHWANAKNADGSYFVWIPRYAYRITYYDDQADRDDPSKITGYYDGYGQWRASDGSVRLPLDPGVETVYYKGKRYIVHPAFTNDSDVIKDANQNVLKPAFDLGGWDKELAGFWVAKYEMCTSNATDSSAGSGTTFKSLPNVISARNITVGNCYTYSLAYDTGKQSHLMKNSEWGAVAYLTHSQYGRNGNEIDTNNSSSYITGNGGESTSAAQASGTINAYNSANGTKASTTGNVYGVYDLSGGAWEYLAGYDKASTSSNISNNGGSFATSGGASTKYVTVYSNGTSSYQGNSMLTKCGKIGGSTKEVNKGGAQITTGTTYYSNWFNDYSYFAYSSSPFFLRGGTYSNGASAGVFASSYGDGGVYNGGRRFSYCSMPIEKKCVDKCN